MTVMRSMSVVEDFREAILVILSEASFEKLSSAILIEILIPQKMRTKNKIYIIQSIAPQKARKTYPRIIIWKVLKSYSYRVAVVKNIVVKERVKNIA